MEGEAIFPKMDWSAGDLLTAFKNFKAHCTFMFGGPLKNKSKEEKCNYLMLSVGDIGCDIYSRWGFSDEQKKAIDNYYTHFEAYCKPKSNQIYSRYIFRKRDQKPDKPLGQARLIEISVNRSIYNRKTIIDMKIQKWLLSMDVLFIYSIKIQS